MHDGWLGVMVGCLFAVMRWLIAVMGCFFVCGGMVVCHDGLFAHVL